MEGTNQETAAIRMRGQGDPSSLICPHQNMGWQVHCFLPSLNGGNYRRSEHARGSSSRAERKICKNDRRTLSRMLKKYGLFRIMTRVRISNTPRQWGLTTLVCFDFWIMQIKLFKYSFTSLNKVDTAEYNRTGLNWLWTGENEWRTRRAANASVPLIQSGHTFLQIILLIIPERSIAALNQAELWVRSLCLWHRNTSRLRDSRGGHNHAPLSFSLSLFLMFSSLRISFKTPSCKSFSLYIQLIVTMRLSFLSPFFLKSIYFRLRRSNAISPILCGMKTVKRWKNLRVSFQVWSSEANIELFGC